MGAAGRGHLDVVKALIALGADVNAKSDHGRTALTEAVKNGNVEVVRLLLRKGADVTARASRQDGLEDCPGEGSQRYRGDSPCPRSERLGGCLETIHSRRRCGRRV